MTGKSLFTLLAISLILCSPAVSQETATGSVADDGRSSAQAYEIKLHRPAKVGDKFRLDITARRGKPETAQFFADPLEVPIPELKVQLSADVEVLGTDSVGSITNAAFQFNTFLVSRGGIDQPDSQLPPVTARLRDGKVVLEKNGIPDNFVEPSIQEALSLAIDIIKTTDATPDQLYGTTNPQKIGDSWPINTQLLARELKKLGTFPENAVTGTATVKGETRLNTSALSGGSPTDDVDCLQIGVDVNVDSFAVQIPGFTPKTGHLKLEYLVLMPTHPSLPLLHSLTKVTLDHEAFGTADAAQEPRTIKLRMEEVREVRALLPSGTSGQAAQNTYSADALTGTAETLMKYSFTDDFSDSLDSPGLALRDALRTNDFDTLAAHMLDKEQLKAWAAQTGKPLPDAQAEQILAQRRRVLEMEFDAIVEKLSTAYHISLETLALETYDIQAEDESAAFALGKLRTEFTAGDRTITIASNCRKHEDLWYIDVGLVLEGVTQGFGQFARDDYGSIGVSIKYDSQAQYVRVEAVVNGSPAANADLQVGDIIEAIDGQSVYQASLAAVVTRIKGPLDSEVGLQISRAGEIQEFHIKRALTASALRTQLGRD